MVTRKPFYFVVHSKKDHDRVLPVVEILEQDIEVWLDTMLQPGQNWRQTIYEVLHRAAGLLLFISQANLETKPMQQRLQQMAAARPGFIIPIMLDDVHMRDADIAAHDPINATRLAPAEIAQAILTRIYQTNRGLPALPTSDEIDTLAQSVAEQVRGETGGDQPAEIPTAVFIVHGHDTELLQQAEDCLRDLNIHPIVLVNIGGVELSLFQKFLRFSEEVRYAIVLISADDYGASRRQYDAPNVGDRALQFRMRQNVLLELGFFYGYLGWENVFVLFKPSTEVFPNFEMPSDLGGILFDTVDSAGRWRMELKKRLKAAGFQVE